MSVATSRLKAWLISGLRWGALFAFLMTGVSAGYDHWNRWPPAAEALLAYPDKHPLLVSFHYRSSFDGWARSAQYALLPANVLSAETVIVAGTSRGDVTVRNGRVNLLAIGTAYFAFLAAGAWAWLRSSPPKGT